MFTHESLPGRWSWPRRSTACRSTFSTAILHFCIVTVFIIYAEREGDGTSPPLLTARAVQFLALTEASLKRKWKPAQRTDTTH